MKNLFNDISQDEKNRILEMHQSATRKNYLSEQTPPPNVDPKKPSIVPATNKPQGTAGVYSQIDVATFNQKFTDCWGKTQNATNYNAEKAKVIQGGDESARLNLTNNHAIRMALFGAINQFYLKSLMRPMDINELSKSWDTVKGLNVTYNFTDPRSNPKIEKQVTNTLVKVIPNVTNNEEQMKKDYVNLFNCALKSVQGT
jgi:hypothetical protein